MSMRALYRPSSIWYRTEGQRVDLAGNLAKPIIQQSLAIDPITPISKQILAKHKQR